MEYGVGDYIAFGIFAVCAFVLDHPFVVAVVSVVASCVFISLRAHRGELQFPPDSTAWEPGRSELFERRRGLDRYRPIGVVTATTPYSDLYAPPDESAKIEFPVHFDHSDHV